MRCATRVSFVSAFIVFATALLTGCTSIPRLDATYQLPPPSGSLRGESLVLVVEDVRSAKEIIAQGAAEEFQDFPGSVTLRISHPNEPAVTVGLYDPPTLVQEAFQRRLKNLGVTVAHAEDLDEIHLKILLEVFRLDLVDRYWVAALRYEARLEKDGKMFAGQSVSGSAERLKVLGRKGADEVTSQVVTDTVNRLEIERLVRKAQKMVR